jgi:hypothetical protein
VIVLFGSGVVASAISASSAAPSSLSDADGPFSDDEDVYEDDEYWDGDEEASMMFAVHVQIQGTRAERWLGSFIVSWHLCPMENHS